MRKILLASAALAVCNLWSVASMAEALPNPEQLASMAARFAPVEVKVDVASLPAQERAALAKLVEASRYVDALFMRQRFAGNNALLLQLLSDRSALGRARVDYFLLNKGPWSELDEDRAFLPGVAAKPPGGNFYPADATREQVDSWMQGLPQADKTEATGFFTTIRRGADGKFLSVPYSLEYQGELMEMARLLREAAALTQQPTLQAFLQKRAEAFVSNDYYASDVAWMELDASIEPTIGPYEVYEDEWFNFKAAFEAFITLTDAAETDKLKRFSSQLQDLEDHLPIDKKFRKPKLGGYSPIRVVNVVFSAGDANHGVQTAAYNLPNDERVVAEKGSKRVLLKNFQQAKFDKVLTPIADIALVPQDRSLLSFDAFFTHILMHELMHGLGPQTIDVGGRQTTVRQELKELNGPLEEAKADVSGLWALQHLMDKGFLDKKRERNMYVTFLASTFRTLRFGLNAAHAKGMALQVNNLLDAGAIRIDAQGRFSLDVPKTKKAVTSLTGQIMTLQAHGDYAGVKRLLDKMSVIRPEVQRVLDQLGQVPVDIAPQFVTARSLTP
ncbi:dipeptidyl-peptidase 3 family protein [Peristeroidobacter soli]|uniref:dipeptidyl-peptidase 3 family protein n=1 Tax=Peristeroidobacter soli TaxID=2497877 RepID=UPI00101E0AFC